MFYPESLIQKANVNAAKHPWAAEIQRQVIEAAKPWMGFSDEALWDLMFGHTLRRSWMVWSSGHCPSCKQGVPMYTWKINALKEPWKLRCPHCDEAFPKNDFHAYYRSGLDEHGVFDPKRADRSLLYNAEHPDPKDPLHGFGVDAGESCFDGQNRWWFIGTYLIYGQWKQGVHAGIRNLAAAYTVTGDRAYAHKAGVLLDRVADLYPSFDFKEQGVMYEGPGHAGYVSTWHDACEETREMALAYDQVREALKEDLELVHFLSGQAKRYRLDNPKSSAEDVLRNIEDGLLRDPIKNHDRIRSNYPRKEVALLVLRMVLDWPRNRDEVMGLMDEMVEKATAVDGVTGEKGLAGYSSGVIVGLAQFLESCARIEPGFLPEMLKRHPRLHQTYRFHIDTWCLQQYYPQIGDTGSYGRKVERYVGVQFSKQPGLHPSMYTFLWRLYELTGDAAFAQVLHHANDRRVEDLPHDLFADDPAAFQKAVQGVIERERTEIRVGSVNKEQWHLGLLRSGRGGDARVAWLDYDAGGAHGHLDGMNLGLFAKGMDLMPDFGYPPVHYGGGWSGPRFNWYIRTAGHNTVVVDGRDQKRPSEGKTTLWADGDLFRVIRASGAELMAVQQYERTVALIDISEADAYVVDLFRVAGGTDHAKFMHGPFGEVVTQGLSLQPMEDYGLDTQMRHFRGDAGAKPGWSADWKVGDPYQYLSPGSDIHLRYTDLTTEAQACVAEAWVSLSSQSFEHAWVPRLMVRRKAKDAPLSSAFVGVIEPYTGASNIAQVRRLLLETAEGAPYPDADVAVEVELTDGRRDLFVAADMENPAGPSRAGGLVQKDRGLRLDGDLCWVRQDGSGEVRRVALCRGRAVCAGDVEVTLKGETSFIEIGFEQGRATVVAGRAEDVQDVRVGGKSVWRER